jgi:hypothetical protein
VASAFVSVTDATTLKSRGALSSVPRTFYLCTTLLEHCAGLGLRLLKLGLISPMMPIFYSNWF